MALEDYNEATMAAWRASGDPDLEHFLSTDPRFKSSGLYVNKETNRVSHPDEFLKNVNPATIPNPADKAKAYAARALAGEDRLINGANPESGDYQGPIQVPEGQKAFIGQSGEIYYDTSKARETIGRGKNRVAGVIDARAALSASEIRSRNENAKFFARQKGVVTDFLPNRSAAATSTPGIASTRSGVPESPVHPDSYIANNSAPNVPVTGNSGYYGEGGKYLGPQYDENGKVNPLPAGAIGLKGSQPSETNLFVQSREAALPVASRFTGQPDAYPTPTPAPTPPSNVVSPYLLSRVPQRKIIGYDKDGKPIYG